MMLPRQGISHKNIVKVNISNEDDQEDIEHKLYKARQKNEQDRRDSEETMEIEWPRISSGRNVNNNVNIKQNGSLLLNNNKKDRIPINNSRMSYKP